MKLDSFKEFLKRANNDFLETQEDVERKEVDEAAIGETRNKIETDAQNKINEVKALYEEKVNDIELTKILEERQLEERTKMEMEGAEQEFMEGAQSISVESDELSGQFLSDEDMDGQLLEQKAQEKEQELQEEHNLEQAGGGGGQQDEKVDGGNISDGMMPQGSVGGGGEQKMSSELMSFALPDRRYPVYNRELAYRSLEIAKVAGDEYEMKKVFEAVVENFGVGFFKISDDRMSKVAASYTGLSPLRDQNCAKCRFFSVGKMACDKTHGKIAAAGWCDNFKPSV